MTDADWVWLLAIVSGPTVLVLLAAIIRGYSIKIWRDQHRRDNDDDA